MEPRSPPRLQTGYLLGSLKFKLPQRDSSEFGSYRDAICTTWFQRNGVASVRIPSTAGPKSVIIGFRRIVAMGSCVSLLATLEGHRKVVSGIALPSASDRLYTGSKDETVGAWDCQSAQCLGVINRGGEVGCMISEGPWIFVCIPNTVKDGSILAWKCN